MNNIQLLSRKNISIMIRKKVRGSMEKIVLKNTCIIINDYSFGDSPKLERFFAIYEPVTHSYRYAGIYYDTDNKRLYLPRGIDIWYVEQLIGCEAYVEKNMYNKFDRYDDIRIKYLPRDEDQVEALKFAIGKGVYKDTLSKSQLSINLNTGKGKTYVAIGTMSVFQIKSVIITYSVNILKQWKSCILEYTNIAEKEIYNIDGSGSIYRLKTKSEKEINDIKVFLVTHSTIQSYCNANGWDSLNDLFSYLKIGMKFYDEAHKNFDNMCMIDFFTNVYKTYYLTATPARSQTDENRIYQAAFKNIYAIDLFHQDTDPHTHYIAMRYYSRPEPQIISKCKNKYGLDRNKYVNYIVHNERFLMMSTVVLDFIFRNVLKSIDDKLLIYIGTNQSISEFYTWLSQAYPGTRGNVGIYTSMVSDEDKAYALTRQIILTTTKSAGDAIDIKGLKCTLLLAEPFKSEILARQTLGRTRDSNTYYIEIVDRSFIHCNKFFMLKRPVFNVYAKDCKVVDLSDENLNDMYNKIVKAATPPIQTMGGYPETKLIKPFTIGIQDEKRIKPFTIGI